MTNSDGSRHHVQQKCHSRSGSLYAIVISDLCCPLISPFYNAEFASKEVETSEETFLGRHGILCHFTEPGRTK